MSVEVRKRVSHIFNANIKFLKAEEEAYKSPDFDYSIDKLKQTNFILTSDIQSEINNLIKYCISTFKKNNTGIS